MRKTFQNSWNVIFFRFNEWIYLFSCFKNWSRVGFWFECFPPESDECSQSTLKLCNLFLLCSVIPEPFRVKKWPMWKRKLVLKDFRPLSITRIIENRKNTKMFFDQSAYFVSMEILCMGSKKCDGSFSSTKNTIFA